MALGPTQPLTEMSTRNISWGKSGRCVRLTTYHHPVPLSLNLGTLTSWNVLGVSRLVTGLLYLFTVFRRKANWTGYILCRNCLMEHVIEVKTHGRIEVTKDEEEDIRNYWTTLRKRQDSGKLKKKH